MRGALQQSIRFCRSADRVQIAYALSGSGPVLVRPAHWMSHLQHDWESPVWHDFLAELSQHSTLLRYDPRGCGLSDRDVEHYSVEAWVRDLEAVVDSAGVGRFALLGVSQGGPIGIAYAVAHPECVTRMVVCGAYARGRRHRPDTLEPDEVDALIQRSGSAGGATTPRTATCSPCCSCPRRGPSGCTRSRSCSGCRRRPRTPRASSRRFRSSTCSRCARRCAARRSSCTVAATRTSLSRRAASSPR